MMLASERIHASLNNFQHYPKFEGNNSKLHRLEGRNPWVMVVDYELILA